MEILKKENDKLRKINEKNNEKIISLENKDIQNMKNYNLIYTEFNLLKSNYKNLQNDFDNSNTIIINFEKELNILIEENKLLKNTENEFRNYNKIITNNEDTDLVKNLNEKIKFLEEQDKENQANIYKYLTTISFYQNKINEKIKNNKDNNNSDNTNDISSVAFQYIINNIKKENKELINKNKELEISLNSLKEIFYNYSYKSELDKKSIYERYITQVRDYNEDFSQWKNKYFSLKKEYEKEKEENNIYLDIVNNNNCQNYFIEIDKYENENNKQIIKSNSIFDKVKDKDKDRFSTVDSFVEMTYKQKETVPKSLKFLNNTSTNINTNLNLNSKSLNKSKNYYGNSDNNNNNNESYYYYKQLKNDNKKIKIMDGKINVYKDNDKNKESKKYFSYNQPNSKF
jgi:hypothetical protein